MRLLLISPDFNPEETRARDVVGKIPSLSCSPAPCRLQAGMVPMGLATIAALTPDDVEVDIWDEAVRGVIRDSTEFKEEYHLVGITGYVNHAKRMKELGRIFRKRGIATAVGGPGVSSEPDVFRGHFDILFIGEAEYTWPRFIDDWKAGRYRAEYRQVTKVDMADSPLPKWDKIADTIKSYFMAGVQTTRGCPFDCEFCDVISIYGRRARHKSVEQVLQEIRNLERLGVHRIFLCDDNFIGNPSYAKALLKALVPLNQSFARPIAYFTQITVNVAKDNEMLSLLADANFDGVFIGLESPNVESLIETNKPQNYRTDLIADVNKIQSYGIVVQGGVIVGFDHDDTTIFDRQFEFLQEAGVTNPMINMMKAATGTKLWVRLHKEGRVLDDRDLQNLSNVESVSNIIPKQMTRTELLAGYSELVKRVRDWRNFEARAKRMISQVRRRPEVKGLKFWKSALMVPLFLSSIDGEARRASRRLLLHTFWRAPFMLERVMALISHQYLEAALVPDLQESVSEQIRLETEGPGLPREQTVFFVPDEFKRPYKANFPEIYRRIYDGLADKSRTHDSLVEVLYDFVTRWGPSFQHFEDHHRQYLFDLCDRAIAKANNNPGASDSKTTNLGERRSTSVLPGHAAFWLGQLSDDVLRTVEQDLRTFHPQT